MQMVFNEDSVTGNCSLDSTTLDEDVSWSKKSPTTVATDCPLAGGRN